MTVVAILVMLLLGVSVLTLAFGGAEPPPRIQTFGGSSPEEREFARRAARLQMIGFVSAGLAALIGVIGAVELLMLARGA